jgi:hypothetical protein
LLELAAGDVEVFDGQQYGFLLFAGAGRQKAHGEVDGVFDLALSR